MERVERNTVQKSTILEVAHSLNHPTAEEIYLAVREKCPKVSRATVYRNVRTLSEKGILLRLPMTDAPDHYDITLTPHYHVLCTECGSLRDVDVKYRAELDKVVAPDFQITGHEIIFKGVCASCLKKAKAKK